MNDSIQELYLLHELGNTYFSWSLVHHQQAIEYLQLALRLARDLGDKREEGLICGQLGNVYSKLLQPEIAADYFKQAQAIFSQSGDQQLMQEAAAISDLLKRVPYRVYRFLMRPLMNKMLHINGNHKEED